MRAGSDRSAVLVDRCCHLKASSPLRGVEPSLNLDQTFCSRQFFCCIHIGECRRVAYRHFDHS